MNSKLSIVLLWCLIFILGGVAGWFGNRVYHGAKTSQTAEVSKDARPKKEKDKGKDDDKEEELREIIADLVRELHLDAEQQESLKNIFYETRLKFQELNEEFQPRYKMIRNESDDRIREILRDDQRARFEEMLKSLKSQKSSAGLKPDRFNNISEGS